jgi:hypothetical protein
MSSRFTADLVHDIAHGRCASLPSLELASSLGNVADQSISVSLRDSTPEDSNKSLLFIDGQIVRRVDNIGKSHKLAPYGLERNGVLAGTVSASVDNLPRLPLSNVHSIAAARWTIGK